MIGAKEHAMIDHYEECVPLGFIHYSIQETITMKMLMKKGLTLDQAIRELPMYVREEAKRIYRG